MQRNDVMDEVEEGRFFMSYGGSSTSTLITAAYAFTTNKKGTPFSGCLANFPGIPSWFSLCPPRLAAWLAVPEISRLAAFASEAPLVVPGYTVVSIGLPAGPGAEGIFR